MKSSVLTRLARVFRPHAAEQIILQDAENLIDAWGDSAYTVAAEMSWREDAGLIFAAEPGHWDRVKGEVGRRLGWKPDEPEAVFAADVDRLWLGA